MLSFKDGIKKLLFNLHKKRIDKLTRRITVNSYGKAIMMFYPIYNNLRNLEQVQDILVKYGLDNVLDMRSGEYVIMFSQNQLNKWSEKLLSDVSNNMEDDVKFIKNIRKLNMTDSNLAYLPETKKDFEMLNKIFKKYGIIFTSKVVNISKQDRVSDAEKISYKIIISNKDYNKFKDNPAIKDLEHYVQLMDSEKFNIRMKSKTR